MTPAMWLPQPLPTLPAASAPWTGSAWLTADDLRGGDAA